MRCDVTTTKAVAIVQHHYAKRTFWPCSHA